MTDMIEAVTEAIVKACPDVADCMIAAPEDVARAAIIATLDAIREPSEGMIRNAGPNRRLPVPAYQAMIDALKAELEGK